MFTKSLSGNHHMEQSPSRPRFQKVPTAAQFFRIHGLQPRFPRMTSPLPSKYSMEASGSTAKFHEKSEEPIRPFFRTHLVQKHFEVEKMNEKNDFEVIEEKSVVNDLQISATSKALSQMQTDVKRPKLIKPTKISNKLKRQKINEKLVKLLTPKSAINVLHEIKPQCTYTTKELPNQGNIYFSGFIVEVKDGEDLLGTGQGTTKCLAKNLAAENGIKTLFARAMKNISQQGVNPEKAKDELNWSVFPWAGLAQLAIYKLFNEWQLQGPEYLTTDFQKLINLAKAPKVIPNVPQTKKEIPENAHNIHPTTLLFQIHPHMNFVELERTIGPPSRVKIACEFDGQQFCGVSTNKKEAKKEAAKLLLRTVYGVKYEL